MSNLVRWPSQVWLQDICWIGHVGLDWIEDWLVVWNMNFIFFHIYILGIFIFPTDFKSIIFQRAWSTTKQIMSDTSSGAHPMGNLGNSPRWSNPLKNGTVTGITHGIADFLPFIYMIIYIYIVIYFSWLLYLFFVAMVISKSFWYIYIHLSIYKYIYRYCHHLRLLYFFWNIYMYVYICICICICRL